MNASDTFLSGYSIARILNQGLLDKTDARLLLQHILGFSRAQLIIHDQYELTAMQYQQYIDLAKKCLAGMPIAYILGFKEFYSRNFKVTLATLIPRPETELLVDTVLQIASPNATILDLGTGSGCIAITLKLEQQNFALTATDKYSETLAVARENAALLHADIHFMQSDWFDNINKQKYDIIVSNPPYIESGDEHLTALTFEPQYALTDFGDGMSAIKQIINGSSGYLSGYLLLEHGYNQGQLTRELLHHAGFSNISTIRDYAGLERITLGRI